MLPLGKLHIWEVANGENALGKKFFGNIPNISSKPLGRKQK